MFDGLGHREGQHASTTGWQRSCADGVAKAIKMVLGNEE